MITRFGLLLIGLALMASCKKEKSAESPSTTEPKAQAPEPEAPQVIVIGEQSEPDTLKGSIKAVATGLLGSVVTTIHYHSPSVRGRIIWGGLVPYDKVWVTGAHMATQVVFGGKVKIGGATLEPGTYALFTIPGKDQWTIIINSNWNQHLTDNYSEKEDIARVQVKPEIETTHQERLRYVIERESNSRGEIVLYWERLEVSLPVESIE